jgi:hypothetical protein
MNQFLFGIYPYIALACPAGADPTRAIHGRATERALHAASCAGVELFTGRAGIFGHLFAADAARGLARSASSLRQADDRDRRGASRALRAFLLPCCIGG